MEVGIVLATIGAIVGEYLGGSRASATHSSSRASTPSTPHRLFGGDRADSRRARVHPLHLAVVGPQRFRDPVARLGDREHDAEHMRTQGEASGGWRLVAGGGATTAGERYGRASWRSEPGRAHAPGRDRRGRNETPTRSVRRSARKRPPSPTNAQDRSSREVRGRRFRRRERGRHAAGPSLRRRRQRRCRWRQRDRRPSRRGAGAAAAGSVQVVKSILSGRSWATRLESICRHGTADFKKVGPDRQGQDGPRLARPAIEAILKRHGAASWVGWLESVIAIANRGAPIQAVAFTGRRSTLKLVSDKGNPMTTPQDLVGQRIGIPSEGGTSETTLDLMLANSGIDPKKVQRQVTGFTPGTFELIKRKRIAGFIIGGSQEQQFREAQPTSVFLETAKYVQDGLTYITSPDGIKNNKPQIEAYMRALKGAMLQIVDDGPEYTDTIKKLRSKYDFPELKSETAAKYEPEATTPTTGMLDGRGEAAEGRQGESGRRRPTTPP